MNAIQSKYFAHFTTRKGSPTQAPRCVHPYAEMLIETYILCRATETAPEGEFLKPLDHHVPVLSEAKLKDEGQDCNEDLSC